MAKCTRCGLSGITLKLDFDDLCQNCHNAVKAEAAKRTAEMETELSRLREFYGKYKTLPERAAEMETELTQLRAFHEQYKMIPDAEDHVRAITESAEEEAAKIRSDAEDDAQKTRQEAEALVRSARNLEGAAEQTAEMVIADLNAKLSMLLRESANNFHFRSRVQVAEMYSKARKSSPEPIANIALTPLTNSVFKKQAARSGYIAFDFETTGLSPKKDKIIEIGAVRCDKTGKEIDRFSTLVNPECPIPASASAVNHITDDMVANAPVLSIALSDFIRFIGDDKLPLVAHNANFDISFLSAALSDLSISLTAGYGDTLQMARKAFKLDSYRLDSVCDYIGHTITDQHRAIGDAQAVSAIVVEICEL